ncbi:hypothetical protein MNBD_NITROSPIRAE03-1641 [hydrothermal vent metagenome]|uniref:VanZ-like domain-containing protein n=1 Tax=hydrothermal vent metagenome TaxID=652676 RepID=A0A3B1CXQ1_9ZZZZ
MNLQTLKKPGPKQLAVICLLMLAIITVIFLAGLWPLNFNPKNKVEWLKERNGIHFYGHGIVYTPEALDTSTQNPIAEDSVSIELILQPHKQHTCSIARIVSFYDTGNVENLMIGQWKSHLIIRSGDINSDNRKDFKEIGLGKILKKGKTGFLTITSGKNGTSLYLDGKLAKRYPDYTLAAGKRTISGQIVLGNSLSGKSPWRGNILGLAIYSRPLTADEVYRNYQAWTQGATQTLLKNKGIVSLYMFDEKTGSTVLNRAGKGHNLVIPATFRVLRKTVLVPIWKDFSPNRSYFTDIAINISGFIPFGFILSFLLYTVKKTSASKMYLTAILSGGAISLTIELLQVYLPTRSSQMSDLIFNILGTILGVALFRFIVHKSNIFSHD